MSFQVLSLDGGGYKGIFAAAVLAQLEEDFNLKITEKFDLVAGTSTGGIIALALGAGLRPSQIVDFYVEHGPQIFKGKLGGALRGLAAPKYSSRPLRTAVEKIFGDLHLSDSIVPLVVPSYDLTSNSVYVFRTPHVERLRRDWREKLVDIALATSAAPTFFSAHRLRDLRLVDGGVWANNPSMVALSEAIGEFQESLTDIKVLSLGTTIDLATSPGKLDGGGILQWARPIPNLLLRGQTLAGRNAAYHLLKGNFLRLDPVVPAGAFRLDRVSRAELMGLAEQESRHIAPDFERLFLQHTAREYTPHHRKGNQVD